MTSKKKFTFRIFMNITSIVIVFIFLAGLELLKAKFDFSKLSADILISKSIQSVLLALVQILSAIVYFDILEQTDITYITKERELEKAAIKSSGYDFDRDVSKLDYYNKVEAHKKIMRRKIDRHFRKQNTKIKKELHTKEPELYSKKTLRWIDKNEELNNMLTKEWIDENVLPLNMNYRKITSNEVLYGIDTGDDGEKSLLKRKPVADKFSRKPFSLIGTMLISIFLLSYDSIIGGYIDWLAIGTMFVIFIAQVATGFGKGKTAHTDRLLNQNLRLDIMANYDKGVYKNYPDIPKSKYTVLMKDEIEEVKEDIIKPEQIEIVLPDINSIEELPEEYEEKIN